MFSIKAKKREVGLKLDDLRKAGEVPAVFYGMGKESTPISVSTTEFKKIWQKAGESSAVKVVLPSGEIDVLIHEVQTDPITDTPIHVDFLAIDMNKKIKVNVPLVFEGIAGAVKSGIGTLVKVLYEIEIEALPKDLPQNIIVDISNLSDLTSQITVAELNIPKGVTVISKGTEIVAAIAEQKEEKEEVAEPVDLSKIEVEKKGKKDEEGAEAENPAPEENK